MENTDKMRCSISPVKFGEIEGREVLLFHLTNGRIDVFITNYGCTITGVYVPDRYNQRENIVSGFDSLYAYLSDKDYMGCIIGQFANRIAEGKFRLNGKEYNLSINDGPNHLHGGKQGFNRKVWHVEKTFSTNQDTGVCFSYKSDCEEGYPGNLSVKVTYLLNHLNELDIVYEATTDVPTIINLSNHSYFNLTGFSDSVANHHLKINASQYAEKNENNTLTGKLLPVENSVLDFRLGKTIGAALYEFKADRGIDHFFVFDKKECLKYCAELYEPKSGRLITVMTDQPGLQVYTANWWDGSVVGSQNITYKQHSAVALETQNFPDAPNHENFPNCVLRPGETYKAITILKFSTRPE